MRINKNFVVEKLDEGTAILLNPSNETIFILNRTGHFVLTTADDCERELAKARYFDRTKLPLTEDYINDYCCFLDQLIENCIIVEDQIWGVQIIRVIYMLK